MKAVNTSRRAFLKFAGSTAAGAMVAACALATTQVPPPATPAPASTSGESVELRIAWWGSQNRTTRTLDVIKLFEKEHPNIKISPEYASYDDYFTKLTTQAAGKSLPDLIQQDYPYIAEWVSRDLLLPLDDYVSNGSLNLKGVSESALSGGRLNGKLFALDLGTNAQAFVFDPELFQKAGVEIPKPGWTWTDLEETATRIHEKLNIYGVSSGLYAPEKFAVWLRSNGATLYNKEGTALGYEDDKLFVDWMNMMLRLMKAGVIPTREFDTSRGDASVEQDLIVTKESAMSAIYSNQLVALSVAGGNRSLQIGLYPGAGADKPDGLFINPSMFFSISAQAKHPAEAAMFMDFFTNSLDANKVLEAERGVPISPTIRDALSPTLGGPQKQTFDYISLVEQHSTPIDPPDPPSAGDVLSNNFNPIVEQVLYGKITPEDGAKQFREQANAVLVKNTK